MGDTALETVAIEFLGFFFGLLGNLISTFVWWWVVYVLIRYLLKNVVFKEDTDGLKRFSGSVRAGFEELSNAFCSTMSGVASVAAQWANEKKEERSMRKASKLDDDELYW